MPKDNRKFYIYLFITLFVGLVGVFTVYAKQTNETGGAEPEQKFSVSVISNTEDNVHQAQLPGDRIYVNTVDPLDEGAVQELIEVQNEQSQNEQLEEESEKEGVKKRVYPNTEILEEEDSQYFDYVRIINSCDHEYSGTCVKIRKGPGAHFPYRGVFRNGQILKAGKTVEVGGVVWQEIIFDEWLRYPNRARDGWYVSTEYTEALESPGWEMLEDEDPWRGFGKRIVIDKTNQTLNAYEYTNEVFSTSVSTGLAGSATPAGLYEVRIKTPSRYMQGPINVPPDVDVDDPLLDWTALEDYYDLPGVPWNLYFSDDGLVIHGAYWHNNFGQPWSHGCVNVPTDTMKEIYEWAELGTVVEVVE